MYHLLLLHHPFEGYLAIAIADRPTFASRDAGYPCSQRLAGFFFAVRDSMTFVMSVFALASPASISFW
jgi:hypothetical protein